MAESPEPTHPPDRLDAAYIERLFEGARLAIFACNRQGQIRGWNTLGAEHFQRHARRNAPLDLREALPPSERALFDQSLAALIRALEPLEFRTRYESDAGGVEYAVWLAPIINDQGGLEQVSVWFHDITARRQLRRAMRKNERLTALGAMSGSVAHHYNNLLCSIATSLEYAMNMNSASTMKRALARTADAVSRATDLTRQLLAVAQADYRYRDLADLTETVLLFLDENEASFTRRNVQVDLDWQSCPMIAVPREAFQVVLHNIVSNALEATPAGGRVRLTLAPRGADKVVLSVLDSGRGIPPEHMEHLFEPFFTTKGELGAGDERRAGMGLAVAYGLVSEMNGTIVASNDAGGGARFDVILPVPQS